MGMGTDPMGPMGEPWDSMLRDSIEVLVVVCLELAIFYLITG